ncbi:MAG: DUF5103 domain-containing protein [Rhodothermales bacterium]|nr:DUF5103 domain-containing protein [Rhodothermales bacterium]MDG2016386.1 DUF5103 domain-containing protein [Rhodothermales bacterium]
MKSYLWLILVVGIASCAGVDEGAVDRPPRPVEPEGFLQTVDDSIVKTIQLHAGESETALPVLQLGRGLPLRLSFDLMEDRGRPLSIYFYHADREWKRDLTPGEFMDIFHRDEIRDYQPSFGTVTPYTHFEYAFPNSSIDFKLSGNYYLRVTEQGMEDEPLFERPFFVAEQSIPVEMRLDNVMIPGRRASSVQPFIRFNPESISSNSFDFTACFQQNSLIELVKCSDRPALDVAPDVAFYLDPSDAFAPAASMYFLDLTNMRPGGTLERTSQSTVPWSVTMAPDLATLPGSGLSPFLNGRSVVRSSVRTVVEPDFRAEYVQTRFRFVPPNGRPVAGRVAVIGSFSNWQYSPDLELSWNSEENWFEGDVLVKQGHHEYSFIADDPSISRAMSLGLPQYRSMYTSFIYYDDIRRQTDRLVAVQGTIVE